MVILYVSNQSIESIINGKLDMLVVCSSVILVVGQKVRLMPVNFVELLNPFTIDIEIVNISSVSCSMADELAHHIISYKVVR